MPTPDVLLSESFSTFQFLFCPTKSNPLSPLNCCCNSTKKLSYANLHHFGCPVYVLNKDIQDGKKARKWTDRTQIGINLGPPPRHASSVSLILTSTQGWSPHNSIANMMTYLNQLEETKHTLCQNQSGNFPVVSLMRVSKFTTVIRTY
jgi:hypothetical protein